MRYPLKCYQLREVIIDRLPNLPPAQQRSLELKVSGTVLAGSAYQNAVVATLLVPGKSDVVHQHPHQGLYGSPIKVTSWQTQVDVSLCFGPLIRWVRSW